MIGRWTVITLLAVSEQDRLKLDERRRHVRLLKSVFRFFELGVLLCGMRHHCGVVLFGLPHGGIVLCVLPHCCCGCCMEWCWGWTSGQRRLLLLMMQFVQLVIHTSLLLMLLMCVDLSLPTPQKGGTLLPTTAPSRT